jgi:HAD superfamily hydrolase (TIGR01509 family)
LTESPLRFKAVLFDLDGTLIEFKFPIKESRLAMFDFLRKNGYKTDHFTDHMRTQDLIDDAEKQWLASEKLRAKHEFTNLRQDLFRILDGFEFESLKLSKPLPGCLETIKRIHEADVQLGIVTNSGRLPVISVLSNYGYLPFMEVLISRNEMSHMKPRPDGLLEALKLLKLQSDDALYVGDSILDIQAARGAGMKCASIPSGIHPLDSLQKLSPDYVLETIFDLQRIVLSNES